jgi:cellulose synthase operon protein YhjQ
MNVIAFVSPKGGAGKSTITANLAVALAQRSHKVLVIDMDPQNAQRVHLGLDSGEYAGMIREGIHEAAIFDSPFGVGFIPFGKATDVEIEDFRLELLDNAEWLKNSIDGLADLAFDFVLIDTPPGANAYLEQALMAANKALVVLQADAASYLSMPSMARLIQEYGESRDDFDGYHYIVNQMPSKSRLSHEVRSALLADAGDRVVPLAVHRDPAVAQALANERPVLDHEPGSMASLDFQYLADWLLDAVEA